MKIKLINARFTDKNVINQIEEDYHFFEQNNYAIHDYKDRKGWYELDIYLTESTDEADYIAQLAESYPELSHFKIEQQKQEDWFEKWKSSLKPLWLTEHFLVDPATTEKNKVHLIRITPGMAFGTGYHETTRLTANLLQQYAKVGDKMLDLGCGSGILSIMGAQLGCRVLAVDLDPFALEATKENIRKNNVISSVTVMESDLLSSVQGQFDIICANILYDILKLLFINDAKILKAIIKTTTTLIFSGLILKQHHDFIQLIKANGFEKIEEQTEGDWLSLAVKLKNL